MEPPSDEDNSDNGSGTLSWIHWFISLPGKEFFTAVNEEYIEDDFNLTGLAQMVPLYREALEMILDIAPTNHDDSRVPDASLYEKSAELLYGLIHQRFINSRLGIMQMAEKYAQGHFGHCPRVYCRMTTVVPCGRYDMPGLDNVRLFCPSCHDLYVPSNSRYHQLDGAYFGSTFPHHFFQTFPELISQQNMTPLKQFRPKIYGFRVSELSPIGPRMQWLRHGLKGINGDIDSSDSDEQNDSDDDEDEDEYAMQQRARSLAAEAEMFRTNGLSFSQITR